MNRTPQDDEYRAAFMADDMPEAPPDEAPAEGEGDLTAALMADEVSGNQPDAGAAEGASGTAASAVALRDAAPPDEGEAPGEDLAEDDYEQKYKTLQGKYNAEIARLQGKIAALESRVGEPARMADGGPVEDRDGQKWDRLKAQQYHVSDHLVEGPNGEEVLSGNGSIVQLDNDQGEAVHSTEGNRPRLWGGDAEKLVDEFDHAPKRRLADGGPVHALADDALSAEAAVPAEAVPAEAVPAEAPAEAPEEAPEEAPAEPAPDLLEELATDYGEDFVEKLVAVVRREVEAGAKPYVEGVQGDLTALIDDVSEALHSMHRATIADAHEDFEEIVTGEAFQGWLAALPDEHKARADEVVARGSAGQIIKLLQQFKDSLKPREPSPEDVWAEDAAAGIKGSAPLKLPTRAPASADDEYRRAWNAM